MKIKHAFIAIILGKAIIICGVILKLNHIKSGSLLAIGLILTMAGGLVLLYKAAMHPRVKEFLNF